MSNCFPIIKVSHISGFKQFMFCKNRESILANLAYLAKRSKLIEGNTKYYALSWSPPELSYTVARNNS